MPGAAVVQEQRLVVVERALQDHRVHVLAIEVGVRARLGVVARFHDHVDDVAQRVEQVHENLEQVLGGDGGGQHGHLVAALRIAVGVAPIARAGDHIQADRRADRVRQERSSHSVRREGGHQAGLE